jgi:glycosyltransferase involved in cell wall biosynthesis
MKHIVFHSVTGHSLYTFRRSLIEECLKKKIQVTALCSFDQYIPKLELMGVKCIESKNTRDSTNPIKELFFFLHLLKTIKKINPDIVHHFTPKCVVYGSVASKLLKIKTIASITGLGHAFILPALHPVSIITKCLYFIAQFFIDHLIFQNPDDKNLFSRLGLSKFVKTHLIFSSGVDLRYYKPLTERYKKKQEVLFTFIGRPLIEKGIREFLDAAIKVSQNFLDAQFLVVGYSHYQNPSLISAEEFNEKIKKIKNLQVIGHEEDIRPYLENTSVIVLPSYREGVPRAVLEAMAYSIPVITTDSPGCRETVVNGVNGFLVPVRNVELLIKKMEYFLINKTEIIEFGKQSLLIVQEKFEATKIVKQTFEVYRKEFN